MGRKMKKGMLVGLALSVCIVGSVLALTPNAGDADLALWLQADVGVVTGACSEPGQPGAGPCVTSWTDSSSNGNVAAPSGTGLFMPTLENFTTSGGRTFPVVRFYDPNAMYLEIPAPANPFSDSTNISGDLSLFVMFRPALNGTELSGGFHSIIAKRGSMGSQYSLFLQDGLALGVVNGQNPPLPGAIGSVFSNAALGAQIMNTKRVSVTNTWHITHMRVKVINQTVEWFDSDTEQFFDKLAAIGVEPLDPNVHNFLSTDPLGIGNHAQPGVNEPYVGDIAEIILYNRALSDVEAADIANYLYVKYYQPNDCGDLGTVFLPSDLTRDCAVSIDDLFLFFADWLKCTDPAKPECAIWWQ